MKSLSRAVALFSLSACPINAQVAQHEREVLPTQHWAAPLYWQITANAAANSPVGSNALVFVGMTPCRILDTRAAAG